MKRIIVPSVVAILLGYLFLHLPSKRATPPQSEKIKIEATEIIDGRTLKLNDGRTVRLIGVDCPEFKAQDINFENATGLGVNPARYASYAQKSKNFLSNLVMGKVLRTTIDPINQITNHHDKHQNFLAYVYVEDVFINKQILEQGQCVVHRKSQFRFKAAFVQAEKLANENGLGLWQR